MTRASLELRVLRSGAISSGQRDEILALCNDAFRGDLTGPFSGFGPATHVLGLSAGALVSHAMWVTRWLQPGTQRPLRTAYVEAVATRPELQRRGYATVVMRRLASEIPPSFEMAALCPATSALYERQGWRFWRGPLSIRLPSGRMQPTPDERIMVLELPGRPAPDLDGPVSAEWREGELW